MVDQQGKLLFFAGTIFYTVSTLLALQLPFFWDTILTSTIANWFYENGVQQGIPPLVWDAGHPTFFQLYLSTCWKIFGQTLAISHLAMLPFLLFGLYAFISLCTAIISHISGRWITLLLFLLHPYLLTQSLLVSYDILQVGFFLAALLGIVRHRFSWLIVGVTGLSLLSLRGQIMGAGLVMADRKSVV